MKLMLLTFKRKRNGKKMKEEKIVSKAHRILSWFWEHKNDFFLHWSSWNQAELLKSFHRCPVILLFCYKKKCYPKRPFVLRHCLGLCFNRSDGSRWSNTTSGWTERKESFISGWEGEPLKRNSCKGRDLQANKDFESIVDAPLRSRQCPYHHNS